MNTCVQCGQVLTPEGFCTICDFGWQPGNHVEREPDTEISVPYDTYGNVDVSELEEQIKKKE